MTRSHLPKPDTLGSISSRGHIQPAATHRAALRKIGSGWEVVRATNRSDGERCGGGRRNVRTTALSGFSFPGGSPSPCQGVRVSWPCLLRGEGGKRHPAGSPPLVGFIYASADVENEVADTINKPADTSDGRTGAIAGQAGVIPRHAGQVRQLMDWTGAGMYQPGRAGRGSAVLGHGGSKSGARVGVGRKYF